MYKIGEFSKITGLSIKALRYYDKEGILCPAKREDSNSYRLYDDNNFNLALLIKKLRELDFSISEINDTLFLCTDTNDLNFVLNEKKQFVQQEIDYREKLIQKITASIEIINKEEICMNYEIEEKTIPSIRIASIRYKGQYDECGKYAGKIFRTVKGKADGEFFNLYHHLEHSEQPDIEVCVPVKSEISSDEITFRVLPETRAITTIHTGRYELLSSAYKALIDYAKEHDYEVKLPMRDVYIKGPGMIFMGNPNKYVTQVVVPIAESGYSDNE